MDPSLGYRMPSRNVRCIAIPALATSDARSVRRPKRRRARLDHTIGSDPARPAYGLYRIVP